VSSMQVVTVGDVGMMPGLFMAPAGIVLGRFFVMAGRMFMVLRGFLYDVLRSSSTSAVSVSACDWTDTYSPAAIAIAPATRPVIPVTNTLL
jgi:hypothetical protein